MPDSVIARGVSRSPGRTVSPAGKSFDQVVAVRSGGRRRARERQLDFVGGGRREVDDAAAVVGQVLVGPGDRVVAHRQRRLPSGGALSTIADQDFLVRRPARRGPVEPQAVERGDRERRAHLLGSILFEAGSSANKRETPARAKWRVRRNAGFNCGVPFARAPRVEGCSGDQFVDDVAVHVGQAEVAAGVAVGELLVVEAQQVQDRGVQVVDVDRVLDGLEAELVGRAVDVAALDAAAGQPHGEAVVVVVAAVDLAGVGAGRAAARPSACGRTRRPR